MRGLVLLSTLALLVYPLAVYFGLSRWGIGGVGGVLAILFLLRLVSGRSTKFKQLKVLAWISGGAGLVLVLFSAVFRQAGWFLFYPVVVNVLMLSLFGSSLFQEQSMIERFARLREPDLPESGVRYTRNVTKIWCGFFITNGTIALITCFQSLEVWTLYNGLISYMLMGGLFVAEFLVRQRVREKVEDA
jgi:uncharacterized membrane protein